MPEQHLPAENLRPPSVLGLLRRRWLAILVPLLVVSAAALGLSLLQEKEYEAETSLLFRDSGFASPVLASQDPTREAATNVRLLQLGVLDERVESRLARSASATVDVVAEADSNLATISVTASSPRLAARVANLYAEEYIALRQETDQRQIEQERAAVESQLAELTPQQRRGPAGRALENRQRALDLAAVAPSGTRQVSPARPPSSESSPKPVRNTLIGALIGLALGVGLAIAFERRDRRVRDARDIEDVFESPIVGKIPRSRALAKSTPGSASELPAPEAEAFRTLRGNLSHLLEGRGGGAHSLLVTSARPSEGKTTVAWNLSRAAAVSGAKVLLIEADMRRPVLAASIGADGALGLSQLLSGSGALSDVVQTVSFDHGGDSGAVEVDVLLAGPAPPNPNELFDSGRMEAVLNSVPKTYDLVIIDTPPIAVVSDAMPILGLVDGVIVVGRLGLSTHESIVDLRDRLATVDAEIFGVVVNSYVADVDAYDYYYRAETPSD